MVVAQVIGNLNIGGAERLFVNLCNSLQTDRAKVFLIGDGEDEPNLVAELRPDIEVHRVHIRKRSWPRDVRRLAKRLSETGCDVVHTHMFWPNLYGALAANLADLPLVTSEHGRNEWKSGWHRWLEVHVISRVAATRLCVSQDILRCRRDEDGVPERLLQLVPNGTVVPPMAANGRDEAVIGSVGRLVDAKDFPTLIRAAAILAERDIDARLEIVGDGEERSLIEQTIGDTGIGSRVTLAGSQTNVADWLARWMIFSSSSVREGQPVALLEAMAAGLPCVVTGVGGVPETLEDGIEGIVVPPGDPEALADGLQRFLEDERLRDDCGHAARERVIRDFSIDSHTATCQRIYASALNTPAAGAG